MSERNSPPFFVQVLHVRKGYEDRELFMKQQLERLGLAFQWVLEHDMQDLKEEDLLSRFNGEMAGIRPEVSCALKHIEAWKNIATGEYSGGLILEDDMILDPKFGSWMHRFLEETRTNADFPPAFLLSLENSTLSFVPASELVSGRHLYPADRLRCAGAYYLSREGARRLLHLAAMPISKPIDWWMGEQREVAIFWSHPTIAEQGSHNGRFASGIDHKPKSLFRRVSFAIQKWIKTLKNKNR